MQTNQTQFNRADGAGYDSLPVFAMRERLAGPIVAVNFAEPEQGGHRHDYDGRPHWLHRVTRRAPRDTAPFPLLSESLVQAFRFSGNSRLAESMQACDLVLLPHPPPGAAFLNWSMHRQLLEAGYNHAVTRIDELERAGDAGLAKIRDALA